MKNKNNIKNNSNNSVLHFIDSYFQEIIKCIVLLDKKLIENMIEIIIEAYENNKNIYILGNGGAASTSSHMACDLNKGTLARTYDRKEKRLRALSLTDNIALITAYANDINFDDIFLQQLSNFLEKNDIVIAISGSGNSQNIINAVNYAKRKGAKTFGLTGFKSGGKLAEIVDFPIIIDSEKYGPIEDLHMMIGHLISGAIAQIKNTNLNNEKNRENKSVPYFIK